MRFREIQIKTRRTKPFGQGLGMLRQREGQSSRLGRQLGGRVNGLGLAVSRWAGPEPCYDWSQLLVQVAGPDVKAPGRTPEVPAPESGQGTMGAECFQPDIPLQTLFGL